MKSLCFLLISVLAFGCSKERSAASLVDVKTNGTWASLSAGDVVVRVDDRGMTKEDVEKQADFLTALFVSVNPMANETVREQFKRSCLPRIIGGFANRKLFLSEACRAAIKPTEEDFEAVAAEYRIMMGGISTNKFNRFIENLTAANKAVYERELLESATINAYWRQKHPSLYTISEQDVKDVEQEVVEMRKKAEKQTAESWEKAREALSRAAKEEFDVVADEMSAVKRDEDALWGEKTPNEVETLYPDIAREVEKLSPGQVTGVIEQDDGLHIVKLIDRRGAGAVSPINKNPETLELGHIVVQLPYEYRMAPVEQVVNETRRLRLAPEKKKLSKALRQAARIEYPSGTNFWPKAEKRRRSVAGAR